MPPLTSWSFTEAHGARGFGRNRKSGRSRALSLPARGFYSAQCSSQSGRRSPTHWAIQLVVRWEQVRETTAQRHGNVSARTC